MGFEVRNSEVKEKREFEMENFDQDPDTVCGMGAFKPRWLQRWATPRTYLFLYSILGTLGGSYYTYRIGVLSTLEKRFAFKSKTSGIIMMVDEVIPIFLSIPVGHFASRTHRPRMIGFGMFLVGVGCFVSAFPYFIYGPGTTLSVARLKNETGLEMCDPEMKKESCEVDDRPPTMSIVLFLMFASFLKGFGNVAFNCIGIAYMDDNAKKKNTPLYLGVTFSLRFLGPLIGFLIASACLKFYENPFDDPGYGPDDPRWVGAWWIGFLFQGTVILFLSAVMALFPRRLPGHKMPESNDKGGLGFLSTIKGLLSALKRLGTNALFVIVVLQDLLVIGTFGHYMMLPKYMENQFRMSASDANLFSGPLGIAAMMSSIVTGGFLVWKFKPTPKFLTGAMVVLEVIACMGYLLLMIPRCESVQLSHFGLEDKGLILDGACNINCNCSRTSFTPICGSDGETVFFSPCHAGCTEFTNKTFSNCSCAWDSTVGHQLEPLTEGYCADEKCRMQALAFIIILPIFQFVVHLDRVAIMMVFLRSIPPADKSLAMGVVDTVLCSLGYIPFLAAFGSLVDSACIVWEESCGETGNCWLYDMNKFNYLLHGTSSFATALSAICLLIIFFLRGRLQDFYGEDYQTKAPKQSLKENAVSDSD